MSGLENVSGSGLTDYERGYLDGMLTASHRWKGTWCIGPYHDPYHERATSWLRWRGHKGIVVTEPRKEQQP